MSTVDVSMAKAAARKEQDNQKSARGSGMASPKLPGPAAGGKTGGNKATKGAYLK